MVVVSDTTTISNLIQIEELHLLKLLFEEILVPEAVYQELSILSDIKQAFDKEIRSGWIKVNDSFHNSDLFNELSKTLHNGEAEAIVLAVQLDADYLIIDEKDGRKLALSLEVTIIGTIGILIKAKQKGLIESIQTKMDELRDVGFWISNSLYNKVVAIEREYALITKSPIKSLDRGWTH